MSSILNVILPIISLATVQLGAIHPRKMHTIFITFSTSGCALTYPLISSMCALVNLRIECSVIFTAYENSSSIHTKHYEALTSQFNLQHIIFLFQPRHLALRPQPPTTPSHTIILHLIQEIIGSIIATSP